MTIPTSLKVKLSFKTCSGCGRKTNDYIGVDCCGRIFCPGCQMDLVAVVIDQPDNKVYNCTFCLNERLK